MEKDRLVDVLSEFARTMVTDFSIQAILDHLVLRVVEVLPIQAAGVTLISPDSPPRYLAASSGPALQYEQIQVDLGEGPCTAACATGLPVVVEDLSTDGRWPAFSARASALGLTGVCAFPLGNAGQSLGALDLYLGPTGPLHEDAMAAAQTLADVTGAYLLNARTREELLDASLRNQHRSLHDSLTGLPNRGLLMERLDHAILRSRRSNHDVAILYADLDGFKSVNDTYGHHVGDELLVAVASRLIRLLRPGDTLARLSGDEFAVLCEELHDPSQAEQLAARIGQALVTPFDLSCGHVPISASVGIAFAGAGSDVPEQVLRHADTAMYRVKRTGGGRHAIARTGEHADAHAGAGAGASEDSSQTDPRTRAELQRAAEADQLAVVYQPIATMSGEVTGVEALLRWRDPTRQEVGAGATVLLAERSGLIVEIGRWVLQRACQDRWRMGGDRHPPLRISVNVSTHQLLTPDFADTVAATLEASGTSPAVVTLEITESAAIQESAQVLGTLHRLRAIGVSLALDDFGTGWSSLSYLKDLPADVVKLDRSFAADLGRVAASAHIVGAVIDLAHTLGMTVVAEGIETEGQRVAMAAMGCDSYQGFQLARPMAAADVGLLLSRDDAASGGSGVEAPFAERRAGRD